MKNDDLLDLKPKKDLKKPLIIGAVAFLIFIIIVIIVAIFQNNSSNTSNEIIPPETQQNINPKSQFKSVEIVEENNIKLDDNSTQNLEEDNKNIQPEVSKENQVSKKNNENKITKKVNNQPQKAITSTKINLNNTPKKIEKPHKISNNSNIHKKIKKVKGTYYIQVAALLKNTKPNPKFLKIIKKAGFNYKFYHTIIIRNGNKIKVNKILVGPFKNRKEAKRALIKVKEKITQNAFIFKVKNGLW